ncbi:hypothetical protein Scep_003402 [Stephania cephalantha]|uniref:Uncharacterized protein n=1 Tax=Stephania cephalantha TaxID=152367 RepID=A0AAP0KRX7_9MAGN
MKSLDNESAPRFRNSPKQRWLGFRALHQKRRSQLAIDRSIATDLLCNDSESCTTPKMIRATPKVVEEEEEGGGHGGGLTVVDLVAIRVTSFVTTSKPQDPWACGGSRLNVMESLGLIIINFL